MQKYRIFFMKRLAALKEYQFLKKYSFKKKLKNRKTNFKSHFFNTLPSAFV